MNETMGEYSLPWDVLLQSVKMVEMGLENCNYGEALRKLREVKKNVTVMLDQEN